jgi:hypothetical protein
MKEKGLVISLVFVLVMIGFVTADNSFALEFEGITYNVELVSASDTTATIKVTDSLGDSRSKQLSEQLSLPYSIEKVKGLDFILTNVGEILTNANESSIASQFDAKFLIGIELELNNTDSVKSFTYNGKTYTIEMISASDTAASIKVTDNLGNEVNKEVDEEYLTQITTLYSSHQFGDIKYLPALRADETNLKLYATILPLIEKKFSISIEEKCEEGYVCLDSDNSSTTVIIEEVSYNIELLSATDTSATIKVNEESKEITEGDTKEISGINVYVKSADESAEKLSVVLKLSKIGEEEKCEEGYVCLDSDNSSTTVIIEEVSYNVELISASDTAATIKVNDESKEIIEGSSKEVGGLNVYVKSADESAEKLSVVLKLSKIGEEETCENGCLLNENCYPYNNRKKGNYCDVSGEWVAQVADGGNCENNFECKSNVCVSGQCVEGNLIQKILAWFRKLFGLE